VLSDSLAYPFGGLQAGKYPWVQRYCSCFPITALMKDQVDSLARGGIRGAAVMDSTKRREEHFAPAAKLRNGELKLRYCAPSRLNKALWNK